ncbi:HAMP domain-containing sensor histidine kinase [Microbacterium sp. STN6]|uniref:sensor histidine kinase n=1 Tax=Microbacterium sp. STN6 TaxID=2995588 RepID=UPI002260D828|nr:HAMP domain-containing sensor histidine kinase [Microbacterium sp. STN6]MCX7522908.1 HAMP domain-containing sensor histidine kinase [Microbacterium sp. STN6]
MKRESGRPIDSDAASVRRASLAVGWQIALAAAAIVVVVVVAAVGYVVYQSRPQELLETPPPGETRIYVAADKVLVVLAIIGAIAIVLAGLISWVIARRAVRPLGEALRIQRSFVADAGHELRTPLAVLDARIQMLQRRLPRDLDTSIGLDISGDLVAIRQDTGALIDVVADLLLIAAGEQAPADAPPTRLGPLVAQTAESMQLIASPRHVTITVSMTGDALTPVPETSLRRCLVALLDNAIAHSPEHEAVTVEVTNRGRTLELVVTDRGPGIHGIEPARIFDRFAHSDPTGSTTERRSGFGIGLSLVRDIAVRHSGRVEIRQTSSFGTSIALVLPRVRAGVPGDNSAGEPS